MGYLILYGYNRGEEKWGMGTYGKIRLYGYSGRGVGKGKRGRKGGKEEWVTEVWGILYCMGIVMGRRNGEWKSIGRGLW